MLQVEAIHASRPHGHAAIGNFDGADVVAVATDFASTGGSGGHGGGGFPVYKGALIKCTTNVTIPSNRLVTLGWEAVVEDIDGFANLGSQPTRLTVLARASPESRSSVAPSGRPAPRAIAGSRY